jgi:hypothetical protein
MAFVRDKAAEEADVLCTLGQCVAALPKFQIAIELGHLPSQALQAWLLLVGREGLAENPDAGFQLAKKGAHLGSCDCKGVMAMCFWKGLKHEVDAKLSLKLARESSLQNSKFGQYALALFSQWGEGGVKTDNAQAYAYFKLAAEQKLAEAQSALGEIYHSGRGVDQDHYKARDLHLLAAAQGNPRSNIQCSAYGKTFIIRNACDQYSDQDSDQNSLDDSGS